MADQLQKFTFNCLIAGWIVAGILFIVGLVVTGITGKQEELSAGNSSLKNDSLQFP